LAIYFLHIRANLLHPEQIGLDSMVGRPKNPVFETESRCMPLAGRRRRRVGDALTRAVGRGRLDD
jgi:hypothetical protein